ncbi:unnamed protein product [Enterobius vermicularis]|uniref:Glutamyl-tRNA(Gln) amidotransferase subunit C, mitochondrial n=1 Tax=Enterobius vermicularis TaxID=51028 RepID=A0A0N4VMD4_ENTVE|nr:unnamed protein product [Enterobius vermicularis]
MNSVWLGRVARFCRKLQVRNVFSFKNRDGDVFIPLEPCPSRIDQSLVEEPPYFDEKLIANLERLSLVRFSNEEAVAHLRMAVRYANQLMQLDTENVEPLETVLEDLACPLRDDVVDHTVKKKEVLMNAVELVEDYFVSPPGNVPLQEVSNLDLRKVNEWDLAAMQDTSKKKLFK